MATITDSEIRNDHPWFIGVIFFVVGVGMVVGGQIGGVGFGEGWILYVVGAVFAVIGLLTALWISHLRVYLVDRTWTFTSGWRWGPTDDSGDFGAFEGLKFTREKRSSGSGKNRSTYTVWCVYLQWTAEKGYADINLFESRDELESHGQLEMLGKKLDLKMVDATGAEPREIDPAEADLTLKDRAKLAREAGTGGEVDLSELSKAPPGARSQVDVGLDGIHVTLPRGVSRKAGCFLALFAIFWNALTWTFVVVFVWGVLKGEVQDDMPVWAMGIFLLPFVAVGIGVALGALWMFLARPHLKVSPDLVIHYVQCFGRDWSRKEIPAGEIEEVGVRESEGGESSVVIRSDKAIIRVAGRIDSAEKAWLSKLVEQVVSV